MLNINQTLVNQVLISKLKNRMIKKFALRSNNRLKENLAIGNYSFKKISKSVIMTLADLQ